ncbi:hypothetical protein [Acidithiobacillus thiooxidans]
MLQEKVARPRRNPKTGSDI